MYQRSSRRPLTILVGLSLALNAFLLVTCMQMRSNLNAMDRRVEQMSTVKANSAELDRLTSRLRGCLDEIANGDNGDKSVPKACADR